MSGLYCRFYFYWTINHDGLFGGVSNTPKIILEAFKGYSKGFNNLLTPS